MSREANSSNVDLTQVIHSNNAVVDRVVVIVCAVLSVIILTMYSAIRLSSTNFMGNNLGIYMVANEILLFLAVVVYCLMGHESRWPRFLYVGVLMFTALIMSSAMSLSYLIFAFPILIVTSYYDRRFTLAIAVVGAVLMCFEPFVAAYMGVEDMNFCTLQTYEDGAIVITSTPIQEAIDKFVAIVIPSLLVYAVMTMLSVWVTTTGLTMVKERISLTESSMAMENELAIASDIQSGMLPSDFPDNEFFSVDAVMRPAKDVGGDFYDFIRLGTSHGAFLVADVSGKGVPAALFMANAKTLIRSNLKNGMSADVVFDRTNAELLQTNKEKLFVTVWLGILDISTGTLTYANAGHNPPYIIHADGTVESIDTKPNFVLGRKKGIRYKEHRMTLSPGDKIFLYTDGLTDSTDLGGRMFSEDRVRQILSSGMDSKDIIPGMMDSVDAFSKGAEQFDDITMLLVDFKKLQTSVYSEGEEFPADSKGHDLALSYIEERLKEGGCSEKVIKDMVLSASEIIANIDMYAYQDTEGGTIRVSADVVDRIATVTFRDRGPEYNPLERSTPDTEKRLKEHKIGGFGIFIVRKLMDDVRYKRVDDMNVLTIMKEI